MTKDTQAKPSAGVKEAARKIWCKQYPNLPSVDVATVQEYARIIDRETGMAELLEATPRISTDGDGDVWMHAPNVGINLSAQGGPVIKKNLLAWAEKMKQAISKCESGTGDEQGGSDEPCLDYGKAPHR